MFFTGLGIIGLLFIQYAPAGWSVGGAPHSASPWVIGYPSQVYMLVPLVLVKGDVFY